ncbi:MAG TPA: ABC transporter ATP-binding protein [Spirochaetales bacterium]|nr:ABC transporter ATP-binding protein [Spirochaetales bacterium]
MELLRAESISKNFGGVVAVSEFSLVQEDEQISAIIGPNGAGKTTTFNLITGIQRVDEGRLFFRGTDITRLPSHRITALGISRTFQNIRLFENLSVVDNVKVASAHKIHYRMLDEFFSLPSVRREEEEVHARAMKNLAFLNLETYANHKPRNLSYGLQRRLELARALMPEPRLLLLDEPGAGLNPNEIRELMETIRFIHREKKISIIIVEHHMELVMNICSKIHVLDFGKKIAEGTPEEVMKDEKVLEAYLGDVEEVC